MRKEKALTPLEFLLHELHLHCLCNLVVSNPKFTSLGQDYTTQCEIILCGRKKKSTLGWNPCSLLAPKEAWPSL